MSKPVVRFFGVPQFYPVGDVEVASLTTVDHPRLGATSVRTSAIVKHSGDGSFETMNTIYVPYKENDDTIN